MVTRRGPTTLWSGILSTKLHVSLLARTCMRCGRVVLGQVSVLRVERRQPCPHLACRCPRIGGLFKLCHMGVARTSEQMWCPNCLCASCRKPRTWQRGVPQHHKSNGKISPGSRNRSVQQKAPGEIMCLHLDSHRRSMTRGQCATSTINCLQRAVRASPKDICDSTAVSTPEINVCRSRQK